MKNYIGNSVCCTQYQKEILRDQIISFYFKKTKKIGGPFCKYNLAKIEAFIETIREFLIFDIFEYLVDFILSIVSQKDISCFEHIRFTRCLDYSTNRKRFSKTIALGGALFIYKGSSLLFRVTKGLEKSRYFTLKVAGKSSGLNIILRKNSRDSIEALETIEEETEDKITSFDFEKNEVWIKVSIEGIECKRAF